MKEYKPKTQGQKIRAILYLLWEAQGCKGTAEQYYQEKTEKYINFLKKRLEEIKYGTK